jgi:hypothetical protein
MLLDMFKLLNSVVDSDVGCEKLHGFFQYPPLVKSLAYTIVDKFLRRAFPGIQVHDLQHSG